MSLSVWSNEKNCFVLAPMKKEVINAFHPDYVKTYMPDFMKEFRTQSATKQMAESVSKHVEKVRKTKPSHGKLLGMGSDQSLMPRTFHVYAKARSKE